MKHPDEEEISFLRTDDHVCLSSVGHGSSDRFCLSANGFGSRTCFLENLSLENNPPDLSLCVFVLDQALSVRALQEVVAKGYDTNAIGGQSGHKTLLYGHAVLLKHTMSNMFLSCLSTSSSADKLAFDVGLQEEANSEACWWTVHPATKQRSEGEKVRIGDDLILVSVSSERYLHLTADNGEILQQSVIASFQQTLWTVIPVSSGAIRQKSIGMVFGGDVLRLFHGDECLTVPHSNGEHNPQHESVMYEIGAVSSHARSLWRLELIKTKWSGGFITWGSKCRLRHVTSGRYLSVIGAGNEVTTVHRCQAGENTTAFYVRQSKDDKKSRWEEHEEDSMGSPDIKFGETTVFLQHVSSNRWLSYEAYEIKKRGVGKVEEKQAVVLVEGHMDDGFTLAKGQDEESKSAAAIRRCASVFSRFIQVLDEWLVEEQRSALSKMNLHEVIRCLEDLIDFFVRPNMEEEHEIKQIKLTALRNRQDLFQEEGIINLMLATIDKFTGAFKERRDFIQAMGEDKKEWFDQLSNYLYLLLAAMIRGNRANCAQFAQVSRMDWMFHRLESPQSAEGVLDVLHCVLTDSDEALNIITDLHIRILIRLLDKKGRDPRVLQVLCSLCMGRQGGAVRLNQCLIYDNLLPDRDLLLQTRLVDLCSSVRPNLFIGVEERSATYQKWYYEVRIDSIEHVTNNKALLRVGWSNNEGFCPFPGGRQGWGSCAVGDDLFSFGFDGENLWTGGKPKRIRNVVQQPILNHGDIIGCMLDLTVPVIQFAINNEPVKGYFRDFNIDGMFYPCLSASAKVSVRMIFGGPHGRLRYGPPDGYSAMFEALLPKERLRIEPCFSFGNLEKSIYAGNSETKENVVFIPRPVETNDIQLPSYVENIRDKLAENIHEMWAMQKIDQGWTYGPVRDDVNKTHLCLTTFERLPHNERQFDVTLAYETLRTIVALGYTINYEMPSEGSRLKTIKLPNSFLQSNGYRPQPLDLSNISLSSHLEILVNQLAENTHNIWAMDRIKQGWSYGCVENNTLKRSPHLVPYEKVDDMIKKSNRQTSMETVKTLLAYNYTIETPPTDISEIAVSNTFNILKRKWSNVIRTFRAQSTWKVTSGKWYYEVELLTCGFMRFGWVMADFESGCEIGSNSQSYAFDTQSATKWNLESGPYGKICQPGDVIGCMLDLQDQTITFSLNGELMMDPMGQEIAFKNMSCDIGYVPGFSFGPGQYAKINFGNDVHTLKYFTCCGLQEGYSPYCVNMSRPVPLWYSREDPCLFVDIDKENTKIEVQVHTGSVPTLKLISKTFGVQKSEMEFLRLGLPIKCKDHFTSKSLQERHSSIELMRRQLDPIQIPTSQDPVLDQMPSYPGTLNRNLTKNLQNISSSTLDINKKGKKMRLGKNPFKKNRSRDASPDIVAGTATKSKKHHVGIITPGGVGSTSGLSGTGSSSAVLGDLGSSAISKTGVDDNDYLLPEMQLRENSLVELMDQYYFSVVVLPGQDTKQIHIGWVTSSFKLSRSILMKCSDNQSFDARGHKCKLNSDHKTKGEIKECNDWDVPHVTICQLENDLSLKSSVVDSCMYLINVADVLNNFGTQDDMGKKMSQGVTIGCFFDYATGNLTFELNSRELPISFQVAPMTSLYPAMFVKPSAREFASFELGRTRNTLPVIAGMLRRPRRATPILHTRLKLQMLQKSHWSRVVNAQSKIHILKLNEVRGWSLLNEESVQMMAVHIPEEDRCLDILELDEHPQLLRFHCETLELYKTICCYGNHNVAQSLTTHMDENQFFYIIQNHYLHGELRSKFFDLLIAMHLESHSRLKLETQNEIVVPLHCSQQACRVTEKNFHKSHGHQKDSDFSSAMDDIDFDFHKIPSQTESCSIYPNLISDDVTLKMFGENGEEISPKLDMCPEINYERLKNMGLKELVNAVNKGAQIIEPIGGSPENIFVPLLKVVDHLLIMGMMLSNDINVILSVLDSVSFKSKPALRMPRVTRSILDMSLQESVKLQLCHLLHGLCDIQLRHRIECIVQISNDFVSNIQNDQLRRYVEIKQSDLPSSVTAKMTKEFRCPPEDQMAGILNFHFTSLTCSEEKEEISCCADELKRKINIFHRKMMDNCGIEAPEGLDINELLSQCLKTKRSRSLHLLPLGIGHPEEGESVPQFLQNILNLFDKRPTEDTSKLCIEIMKKDENKNLSQVIKSTLIAWAKSSFIENIDLIREMFSLLFRQYNALGEIQEALKKTYVISYQSKDDVTQLLRSLGRVRCLLGVQVGEAEEMLLKNCLWDIMNNKVFFQHPNLTRRLAVHETVMQLMVHTLTRSKIGNTDNRSSIQVGFDSSACNHHEQTGVVGQSMLLSNQSSMPALPEETTEVQKKKSDGPAEMVVQCCRFLCYFCRTSSQNQKTMFEHLSYMLENSSMLLARPSLRGTCPLDVAYSSLMDNNELALAIREKQLEKVAVYLSRSGVQSNVELLSKGYPDIGWDPVEGERFLDFLRFTVWVNGECMEENANLVVRLLIRRPECLGPALRGSSGTITRTDPGIIAKESTVIFSASQSTEAQNENIGAANTLEFNTNKQHQVAAKPSQVSGGGGLLKAMKEGIVMSAQIKLHKLAQEVEFGVSADENPQQKTLPMIFSDYEDANLFAELPYNFHNLPPEDDSDYIDLGAAILTFYSVLVDLLGRCAPEHDTSKSSSLRVRAILQSLVSMEDLEGVLSLRFILPAPQMELTVNEDGEEEWKDKAGMPPGLLPEHKASVVLFLERVYGIQDCETFLRLLENAFLTDMRAATVLDMGSSGDSDFALALNRYLGNSVLPLLTKHSHYLGEWERTASILETTLHTAYRLSRCRSLTKGQREEVSDFLVALTQQLQPPMITKLLRKLVIDVPSLTPESVVPLRLLTAFYQRCGSYYSSAGMAGQGIANEEEKQLTGQLFSGIFDNLAKLPYDPELFSKALPCLTAIGCALSPDYSFQPSLGSIKISSIRSHNAQSPTGQSLAPGGPGVTEFEEQMDMDTAMAASSTDDDFKPQPVDTSHIRLPNSLESLLDQFAQHLHDSWALEMVEKGYIYGQTRNDLNKTHPNLISFDLLSQDDQMKYIEPVIEALKAMIAWGWTIDADLSRMEMHGERRRPTIINDGYSPNPKDLRGVNVTREMLDMAEKLAENAHNIWAQAKKADMDSIGGGVHQMLVPFEILTDKEKGRYRKLTNELLKYLQYNGYRLSINSNTSTMSKSLTGTTRHGLDRPNDSVDKGSWQRQKSQPTANGEYSKTSSETTRFAYVLLSKLLRYVEQAIVTVQQMRPSSRYSRNLPFSQETEDIKFFGKVVLPLVERYFGAHKNYFVGSQSMAFNEEKKMAATLFCKLFSLLRQKLTALGHDINISVRCLQVLVQAIDIRAIVKISSTSEDFVRVRLLPFFVNCADDLTLLLQNLSMERFSHLKGTVERGAVSLNYMHMVLLPVLKSMFDHVSKTNTGGDLLVGDVQVACYKILNALYQLGTKSSQYTDREEIAAEFNRHRPLLGECVAAIAHTFPVAFLEPHLNKNNKYSILYNCPGEYSLEAREILGELEKNLPNLDAIVEEIVDLAESGGKYTEAPHVIEVTLPMLCSYLPIWWSRGPENLRENATEEEIAKPVTTVTAKLINNVLGNVLKLIRNNIDSSHAPWMTRIAMRTQPIVGNATINMLGEHFLPVAEKLKTHALRADKEEELYQAEKKSGSETAAEMEEELNKQVEILVRNMFAFYPLLIKYVDLHRTAWIKQPTKDTDALFTVVAEIFMIWSKSVHFKREEQNFVCQNEIDHLSLIMPDQSSNNKTESSRSTSNDSAGKKLLARKAKLSSYTSLNVACIKRLLPIGLSMFGGREQELIQKAKQRLIDDANLISRDTPHWIEVVIQKENDGDIEEYLKNAIDLEDEADDKTQTWQKVLYKKIGKAKFVDSAESVSKEMMIKRVLLLAKVLHGLYLVDHPPSLLKGSWKKLISSQRKRAVMACFRMLPLHSLPRHRGVNLFLTAYRNMWLSREEPITVRLIEEITESTKDHETSEISHSPSEETAVEIVSQGKEPRENPEGDSETSIELLPFTTTPDPLSQLITALKRTAMDQASDDSLYLSYAGIMSKSCSGEDDDDDDEGEGDEGTKSLQEQEMEKLQILAEQNRLSDRGAAEMVLLEICGGRGVVTPVVQESIELGISLLLGGNTSVQGRMLAFLKEKKLMGLFTSISGLMQQCSVLDLDTFERCNKAEGLAAGGLYDLQGITNLYDAEFTCKLFRFLQLLCEGHNLAFQDYLRSQAGNTTTVNIIICTVDYLLRLQESIMDFYWHYTGKDSIDRAGKLNLVKAIKIGKQIFRTLTEYIQGPCVGNQLALAHSRLWDAISGFLFIFAHMQDKLSKDPDQLELLREFMKLQKEMMIMLLSMLEGNVVNGPIGKQMVDTLVESSANVEMILKFFDIFLRMKDITSSEAFLAFDINKDGWISHKEFRTAMEQQKMYAPEEIEYIMMCVDSNNDGKVDFNEFTDRFHDPAKDIGFNVAVLLTNLYEHMPNDVRLERLVSKAKRMIETFEQYLGRIEITGRSGRIERVYFEIRQSHIDQWEKPQIKDSKRSFLHSVVNEGGDKEKLESFVNFCEDTIYEMQHSQRISGEGEGLRLIQVSAIQDIIGTNKLLLMTKAFAKITSITSLLNWSNIKHSWKFFRSISVKDMVLGVVRLKIYLFTLLMLLLWNILCFGGRFLLALISGPKTSSDRMEYQESLQKRKAWLLPPEEQLILERLDPTEIALLDEYQEEGINAPVTIHDVPDNTFYFNKVDDQDNISIAEVEKQESNIRLRSSTIVGPQRCQLDITDSKPSSEKANQPDSYQKQDSNTSNADSDKHEVEEEEEEEEEINPFEMKKIDTGTYIISLFAKNLYNFKIYALVLAFFINFMLLFYEVEQKPSSDPEKMNSTDPDDMEEFIILNDSVAYMGLLFKILAGLHSSFALSMLIAYYCLKVPLVLFKREKEISRMLEFEGMWITEQPTDDNLKAHWDKLVLSTPSFPQNYWDKFVKKKVRNKYSEQYDFNEITNLLGMGQPNEASGSRGWLRNKMTAWDIQYQIWKWGVIFTDNSFLYLVLYFVTSLIGNFNYFFFACHLLDVAISFKTLRTILQSVTHNGKQLVLTVMLTSVIIYLYTVIAFNFFRKFYIKDNDGVKDMKCHNMLTCFVFHLHTGLRAGGGIGDEIESPDGDPYENFRIIFDITFFFFVIVILLAIIQGLIIDAFGELRDQLEQVKEDMESKCFICGIGKEYFDKIPHGFEQHVEKEHNFANYMYFLMHIINKPDTEYTGQETYVWELYQQRCWDFFPVGDCFRKQYEEELKV